MCSIGMASLPATSGRREPDRRLQVTDPLGQTQQVMFVYENAPVVGEPAPAGMNTSDPYLDDRNTFYWDANA